MSHKQVVDRCEGLGMKVKQVPAEGRKSFQASYTKPGLLVYWSTSFEGGLLGAVRIIHNGADTHARSLESIDYYAKQ